MTAVRSRVAVCDGRCGERIAIQQVDDAGAQRFLADRGWCWLTDDWDVLLFCPGCGPVISRTQYESASAAVGSL